MQRWVCSRGFETLRAQTRACTAVHVRPHICSRVWWTHICSSACAAIRERPNMCSYRPSFSAVRAVKPIEEEILIYLRGILVTTQRRNFRYRISSDCPVCTNNPMRLFAIGIQLTNLVAVRRTCARRRTEIILRYLKSFISSCIVYGNRVLADELLGPAWWYMKTSEHLNNGPWDVSCQDI